MEEDQWRPHAFLHLPSSILHPRILRTVTALVDQPFLPSFVPPVSVADLRRDGGGGVFRGSDDPRILRRAPEPSPPCAFVGGVPLAPAANPVRSAPSGPTFRTR